jgi:hypothetical protein
MATSRYIRGKHTDLAVLNLASRTGVLTRDTAGCFALLEEAGLIYDQDSIR